MFNTPKHILVDIDPRRERQPAVERAALLAKSGGASVTIHVSDYLNTLAGSVFFDNKKLADAREDYLADLREWADGLASTLSDTGIDVETRVSWHNPRYEAILTCADEVNADLIMRAAKPHSTVDRFFLGATDWELLRRSSQPVWLVKKSGFNPDRPSILAAVDPSHDEEKKRGLDQRIVETALGWSDSLNGEASLAHAYSPFMTSAGVGVGHVSGPMGLPAPQVDAETMERLKTYHQRALSDLAKQFDIAQDRLHLLSGDAASAIETYVEDNDVDLVVAGAVSRGVLERLLIGSTAEELLDSVGSDILIVKPADISTKKGS